MIKKIAKIKNFGIFENFHWSNSLNEFSRFNLIYGWNGCGKTTFSKIFTLIEYKDDSNLLKNLKDYEFTFELNDGSFINQNNYLQNNINLYVYNEVFKKNNIDWNNVVKSILLISDEFISEKADLDKKKLELGSEDEKTGILGDIKKLLDEKKSLQTKVEDFYSKAAKTIKEEFQVIDTSDKYYFNYDKRKFRNFIEKHKEEIQNKTNILKVVEVDKLKESIKPNILTKIELNINIIKIDWLEKIEERVLQVLKANLVVSEISRLKQYPDIGIWVEQGIDIHKKHKSTKCEFCNQDLPEKRMEELEKHFSKEFLKLKERINNAIEWLQTKKISSVVYKETEFYPEYQETFRRIKNELDDEISKINSIFEYWLTQLKYKLSNPFEIIELENTVNKESIENFNKLVIELMDIIKKHNNKTENFEQESKKLKFKLELHYASLLVDEFKLNKKLKNIKRLEDELEKKKKHKENLKKEIAGLEAKLSNEVFGANEFNKKLHKFLGRDNIELKFDSSIKGYRIIRDGEEANNLSEGEKTAISFVYFVTKLKENDNKIKDSIIVVDDPISSFDSNNLFSAYSFLKNECSQAKQLFVITHNFSYFKLVRDWFNPKKDRSRFYIIEAKTENGKRSSLIKMASNSLLKYNSEYHFIFSQLYYYKDNTMTTADAYLIGNLLRKLLEAFLSFKYPLKRDNFKALCDVSIEDELLREKVYRFINKYSHYQSIDFFDLEDDTVLSESNDIINDVFKNIIEEIDDNHFKEMVEMVKNE